MPAGIPDGTTYENNTSVFSQDIRMPNDESPPEEVKDWVETQLDSIDQSPLLDRFVLLGATERRRGGTTQRS